MAEGTDEPVRINVFEVEEWYLFKHYFDDSDVYNHLRPYYNNQQYRFEVDNDDIGEILTFLSQNGFRPVVVDGIEPYIVGVRKFKEHPKNIFRESVIQRSAGNYHCFVMRSETAVKTALRSTGRPFEDLDVQNPFIDVEESVEET